MSMAHYDYTTEKAEWSDCAYNGCNLEEKHYDTYIEAAEQLRCTCNSRCYPWTMKLIAQDWPTKAIQGNWGPVVELYWCPLCGRLLCKDARTGEARVYKPVFHADRREAA